MGKLMNETIGSVEYNGLIIDACPPADVMSVTLAAGEYKRGTVVTGTAGGNLEKLSAAISIENATYILCDDVTAEIGETSLAYRTGHFNKNALITDGTYTMTDTDQEILRKSGILLSETMGY